MKKKIWLTATALLAAAICFAQPQKITPKQLARNRTDAMEKRLGLSEKQYKKVYKINLEQVNAIISASSWSRQEGFELDQGLGSAAGPGGSMSYGYNGYGYGYNNMRGSGSNWHAGGGSPTMLPPGEYVESEAVRVKREKKMLKILSEEQFEGWKKMEVERLQEEFRRALPPPKED